MTPEIYHIPALLEDSINGLNIKPDGIYADVTFGGGGHSRAILGKLGDNGHLFGFDRDSDALKNAPDDPRFTFVHSNFRHITNFMRYHGVRSLDGILADLGVSFHHFDDPERGFSFRWEKGELDMRMNRNAPLSAAKLIEEASQERLADIFYLYGELRQARQIAAAIVKVRQQAPITTVSRLLDTVRPLINPRQEKKELAQLFQALRIEVNDELGALRSLLTQACEALRPGGRLAIITYHSLEDRLVKNFLRTGNLEGKESKDFFGRNLSPFKPLSSKPIVPDAEEIERNPRSRSAKLRVGEKREVEKERN